MNLPLRDIRKNLPLTPQTDPNKFPMYEYHPYPRMMTREIGGKKVPYKGPDGHPVIVQNAGEEKLFLEQLEGAEAETQAAPAKLGIEIDKTLAPSINLNTLTEKRKPGRPALPKNLE